MSPEQVSKYLNNRLNNLKPVQMFRERRGSYEHILLAADPWRCYRLAYHQELLQELASVLDAPGNPEKPEIEKVVHAIEDVDHLIAKLDPLLQEKASYLRHSGNWARAARSETEAAAARAKLLQARYHQSVLEQREEIGPAGIREWLTQAQAKCQWIDKRLELVTSPHVAGVSA